MAHQGRYAIRTFRYGDGGALRLHFMVAKCDFMRHNSASLQTRWLDADEGRPLFIRIRADVVSKL